MGELNNLLDNEKGYGKQQSRVRRIRHAGGEGHAPAEVIEWVRVDSLRSWQLNKDFQAVVE